MPTSESRRIQGLLHCKKALKIGISVKPAALPDVRPAGSPQRGVGAAKVGGDAGSAEPGSNGATPLGKEGADEQQQQSGCGAAVECGGDVGKPGRQQCG